MTPDTAFTLICVLFVVLVLSLYAIVRNRKQQSLADEFKPVQTPLDLKRKAWADAQKELGRHLRQVK